MVSALVGSMMVGEIEQLTMLGTLGGIRAECDVVLGAMVGSLSGSTAQR